MLGNILGNSSSERRPNAEFVQGIRERWAEVYQAVELEHAAEDRVYPNLFAVQQPVEHVAEPAAAPAVTVTSEVAGNVINLASQSEIRVLNEQEQRRVDALRAVEDARNEIAA